MTVVKFDLVNDLLVTRFAYANKKVKGYTFIKEKILSTYQDSIIVFDLTNAIVDHYFCEAFKDIYNNSFQPSSLDVLFHLHDYQLSALMRGLLSCNSVPYSKNINGDIGEFFVKQGFNLKIIFSPQNEISFISEMDEDTHKVLKFLNQKAFTTGEEIFRNNVIDSVERIGPILEELTKKRFIYRGPSQQYFSIYYFLNSES